MKTRSFKVLTVLAAILGLTAAPALAADKKPAVPESAPTVLLAPVALPVIVDGMLLNYVFVTIRLDLVPNSNGGGVRPKEQYFRDDLVRVGHRTPFTRFDDYTKVDEAKVRAEILRVAPSLVGPNIIKTAVITKQVSQKATLPPTRKSKAPEIVP